MKIRSWAHCILTLIILITAFATACSQQSLVDATAVIPSPIVSELSQPNPSPDEVVTQDSKESPTVIPMPATTILEATEATLSAGPILNDTLILYTTNALSTEATPSSSVTSVYWPLKSWPLMPQFEQPIYDTFYQVTKGFGDDAVRDILERRPQPSPDGRYILLSGSSYNPSGDEGRGLLLVDLHADRSVEAARQLLPTARIVSWSPGSDQIAYVDGNTLYTLAIVAGARPVTVFTRPNLWSLYAQWSPDGRWIATVTSTQQQSDAQGSPELTNTYWLVPTNGESARELTIQTDFAMEYTTEEMAWSPDSQFLLMRNEVFNLTGEQVSPPFSGRARWLPDQARLLINGEDGLHVTTIRGEEIALINNSFADVWAFSHDGQRLAYSQAAVGQQLAIFIFDLDELDNQFVGTVPANYLGLLRWSGADDYLIMDDGQVDSPIWVMAAQPDSLAIPLLETGALLEVVVVPAS
jgi:WD40 repeat protein